jgi:hypothetical protein
LQLQQDFPDLLILAYCDDVHIVGPPEQAIRAYRKWASTYNAVLQGELRDDKGCVYSPSVSRTRLRDLGLPTSVPPEPATPAKMPFTNEGLRVLGAPVGSEFFFGTFSADTAQTITADFDVLARMPSLQGQHVVATKALCHKVNHLLRNVPGGEAQYAGTAARYDAVLLEVPTRNCQSRSHSSRGALGALDTEPGTNTPTDLTCRRMFTTPSCSPPSFRSLRICSRTSAVWGHVQAVHT